MDETPQTPLITAEELSAILAHEIKNPMNSIIINLEVLKTTLSSTQATPLPIKISKSLTAIETEVQRLNKVIKGFLEFANPSLTSKTKFKLTPLLHEIAGLIEPELDQKKMTLNLALGEDSPVIFGNPDQIKQALFNVALNALQSSFDGGSITITSRTQANRSVVSIKDNGSGIPRGIQDKIFTPYFTTKAKGSGIGLSIVNRVIREHDGDIRLESEEGKGAEFFLSFPIAGDSKNLNHET
jgi:signal transduction histidine kinase